mgnify:CR=1 FL=1
MRYNKKKDANQNPIVQILIQSGYSVQDMSAIGGGLTDLLVGGVDRRDGQRKNWLVEIKTEKGKLNPLQQEWHAARHGPAVTCEGEANYEWHIFQSHRISKRARDEQERRRRTESQGGVAPCDTRQGRPPDVAPDGE